MSEITSEDNIELYKPDYLLKGKAIEFCKKAMNPVYSDTFAMPSAQRPADRENLKDIDFEHPSGLLDIEGINITYPETGVMLDEEYTKSIAERVSFAKGKSWHADLLVKTTSEDHHEKVIRSEQLPVSLHLYYDECPATWLGNSL